MTTANIDKEGRTMYFDILNNVSAEIHSFILDFLRGGGTHPRLKYDNINDIISVKQGIWIDEYEADIWVLAEIADEIDNQLNN